MKCRYTIRKINQDIALVIFRKPKDLAHTFLRFQEFYENPKFFGKTFTFEDFKKYFLKSNKKFNYHKEYVGFNIPGRVLKPFIRGEFDPLSSKEKEFLKTFSKYKDGYIIGVSAKDKDFAETIKHEIGHALYTTFPAYKKKVLLALLKVELTPIMKFLKSKLYHESVWVDECHAFLLADWDTLQEEGIDGKKYKRVKRKLNKIFKWACKKRNIKKKVFK